VRHDVRRLGHSVALGTEAAHGVSIVTRVCNQDYHSVGT
jgi:hypothetical protein